MERLFGHVRDGFLAITYYPASERVASIGSPQYGAAPIENTANVGTGQLTNTVRLHKAIETVLQSNYL
jgi:hypothetical protein